MAIPFKHDIDLDQNEILKAVLQKSTSGTRPATPVLGQMTYDTDLKTIVTWNGAAWVSVSDTDAVLEVTATAPLSAVEDGNRSVALTISGATTGAVGVIQLAGDLGGTDTAPSVESVGGKTKVEIGTSVDDTQAATSANTPSTIVKRDASGDFSAGTITATLSGTATNFSGSLVGDVTGTQGATVVSLVGGKTAAAVATAVDKSHDQNTDTGTTAVSFQIDSGNSGPRIKNVGGEMQVRNAADGALADLRVKNISVEGDVTQINSNEVNIGDNEILLNAEITDNALNSDGGIAVKRLLADDTTPANAKLTFNNSTGRWTATDGAVDDLQTHEIARKFSVAVGDTAATEFVVTHNLNSREVAVSIRQTASPYAMILTDVEFTSVDTITVKFKKAPAASEFTVTVIG